MENKIPLIQIDNINYLFKNFGGNENILIGLDSLSIESDGMDLVAYDITNLQETPKNVKHFHDIITKYGLDEEVFEIDRVSLINITNQ